MGKLVVPGIRYHNGYPKHHTERCSASLVSSGPSSSADIIVTAWHCLEYYEDLSQQILFTVETAAGERIETPATQLAKGGDIEADWAVLRLQRSLPLHLIPVLKLQPGRPDPQSPLLMAGYSRDAGRGDFGNRLSYDPSCFITKQYSRYSDSDCKAYKGASGGAVIQLSTGGEPMLSGVISQGNGDDLSRFIPLAVFRQSLLSHLY
ncbi:trypsin-like peptidase domain-containing protein [Parahaliea sp. F7430]|uniref:Trypsin-like peptidase domain-containing protein n=1 Tax=Sediminihaliea albiluteola TaxID=2758564 RepID=A0A7W2YIY4_9GAMM|nr:trypsin-like peptidase domain-containing protein [Sediminihaliea albiluteola]MBA6412580.1 trypsin-like peptidase domain-containing protein [Sediminihaliea albiluteola]